MRITAGAPSVTVTRPPRVAHVNPVPCPARRRGARRVLGVPAVHDSDCGRLRRAVRDRAVRPAASTWNTARAGDHQADATTTSSTLA